VTFVELPEATAPVGVTVFVWANAVPPPDSATDEITAKYTLRFCYFDFSALPNSS